MAFLFIVNDRVVVPNPETLLISPFKEIWERDKSPRKDMALQEFAYIEFMASFKKSNPFRDYPEDRKESIVRGNVIREEGWNPDKLVSEGIQKLHEFQTNASVSYAYYVSSKKAAESMQNFFSNFDINERHWKTGMPVYKPKEITSALIDTERVLTNLNSLAKKVEEELFEEIKLKADKKVSLFADPENFKV